MYLARKYQLARLYLCRLLETGPPFYLAIRATQRSSHCKTRQYHLLSPPPPPQISPLTLLSPFSGEETLINDLKYLNINHDCKTSCGLIRDGFFTNWKFGFDSDPRLHYLKLLVLELFHFVF